MNSVLRMAGTAAALVLMSVLGACGGGGKSFRPLDISVTPGPGLAQSGRMPTVRIEFVGLTADDASEVGEPDPRQWFAGGTAAASSRARLEGQGMIAKRQVSESQRSAEPFSKSDPIWKLWGKMNVRQVLIIADPPTQVAADSAKNWRKIVEAESDTWVGDRVTVTLDNGLTVGTRQPVTK